MASEAKELVKAESMIEKLKESVKKRGEQLATYQEMDHGIPGLGDLAIADVAAGLGGYIDGVMADPGKDTNTATASLAAIGAVLAVGGMYTGHATIGHAGLDVLIGTSAGLAHSKAKAMGIQAKLDRAAAKAKAGTAPSVP